MLGEILLRFRGKTSVEIKDKDTRLPASAVTAKLILASGTISAPRTMACNVPEGADYTLENETEGGHDVTFVGPSGAGVSVPPGERKAVVVKNGSFVASQSTLATLSHVATKAALVAASLSTSAAAVLAGFYARGDFGGGTFIKDSSDSTTPEDGGTVFIDDDDGKRIKRVHGGELFNVRWFGAKGDWDGTTGTDDTDAIDAARAAAIAAGGAAVLFFPRGNYRYTGISLGDSATGLTIRGCGKGVSILSLVDGAIAVDAQGSAGIYDLTIEGLSFRGDGTAGTTGFVSDLVYHSRWTNCEFTGFAGDGWKLSRGFYNEVVHCRSRNNGRDGFVFGRTANANHLRGGHAIQNGRFGVRVDWESDADLPSGNTISTTSENNRVANYSFNCTENQRLDNVYSEVSGGLTWALSAPKAFDDAAWTKSALTVTANSSDASDTTHTADTLTDSVASGAHVVSQVIASSGQAQVWGSASIEAKGNTLGWLYIEIVDGTTIYRGWFDTFTGALGSVTCTVDGVPTHTNGVHASISSVLTNGYYRCTLGFLGQSGSTKTAKYGLATADLVTTYAGSGTGTITVWNALASSPGADFVAQCDIDSTGAAGRSNAIRGGNFTGAAPCVRIAKSESTLLHGSSIANGLTLTADAILPHVLHCPRLEGVLDDSSPTTIMECPRAGSDFFYQKYAGDKVYEVRWGAGATAIRVAGGGYLDAYVNGQTNTRFGADGSLWHVPNGYTRCLRMGANYLWIDGGGLLRMKASAPAADHDGFIVDGDRFFHAVMVDANYNLPTAGDYTKSIFRVTSSVSLTAQRTFYLAHRGTNSAPGWAIVDNQTSGGQSIYVAAGSGTGVVVANGAKAIVYSDGTNFY